LTICEPHIIYSYESGKPRTLTKLLNVVQLSWAKSPTYQPTSPLKTFHLWQPTKSGCAWTKISNGTSKLFKTN